VHVSGPLKNSSAMKFSGTGQLVNASVNTPSLSQPLNVRSADLKFTQNSMTVDKLVASLGQSSASGNLTLRNFAAPQVQFDIMSPKIDLVQLQQITAAKPAPAKRAAWSVVPRAYAAATSQPSILTRMTGTGTLIVGTILYDQLVLNNVRSNVNLNRGLITLSPLTAQVYGGQETGAIVLDARQTPMGVQVQSKLANVDANKLVSSVTSVKQTLYGLLAANTNMGFAAASSADMARTLNGNFNLDLTKGRIVGIDLLHELGNVGKFLSGAPASGSQPATNLLKLTGTFNVRNGLAETNNLQALIEGGSLGATGAVNLVNNALNLHLTAVLSKWFSNKVGGTNVGGFMNTALANQQGELVIPVLVTGTFQHPIVAPDVQKLAQMKLQHVLPTTANPALGQAVGALLGGKNGQKPNLGNILGAIAGQQKQTPASSGQPPAQPPPGQTQNQQQPKANPLGDILNQVFGGKKQQQQQQQQQQKPQ
jgi:uncharacterized protein involved in outer membrane biogenesis